MKRLPLEIKQKIMHFLLTTATKRILEEMDNTTPKKE
jgi:hypothetical protein